MPAIRTACPDLVGVDGCPGGWLAVIEQRSGPIVARAFESFAEILEAMPSSAWIGVDIPMGLPDAGARECEREARQILGRQRMSSVFSAPLRRCLAATSYQEACGIRARIEGKKMSRQAYGILPKIREVDRLLRRDPRLQRRVVEVHPEVSFAIWNGGHAMKHSKKSLPGRAERCALIERVWPGMVDRARESLRGKGCARDDLVDAFAALWTLRRWVVGKALILGDPTCEDRHWLVMRIVA